MEKHFDYLDLVLLYSYINEKQGFDNWTFVTLKTTDYNLHCTEKPTFNFEKCRTVSYDLSDLEISCYRRNLVQGV